MIVHLLLLFIAIANASLCPSCPFENSQYGKYPDPVNVLSNYTGPVHRGKFFDVYGDWIETRYSEVFWTAQPKVDLPSEVRAQFNGRAISITGFEVDILDDENRSVPEFLVYNHHYCATLLGASSQMVKIGSRKQDSLLRDDKDRSRRRAFEVHPPEWEPRELPGLDDDSWTIPTAHNFWQGNGGEHRKSFKHLPQGTGQLIESPTSFVLQPMLINTYFQNRTSNKTARELFHEAPLPKNSLAPPGSNYSGLMECPCTTRTEKIITGYVTESSGTCKKNVLTAQECFDAVAVLLGGGADVTNVTEASTITPSGCSVVGHVSGTEAHFNSNMSSTTQCGDTSGKPVRSKGTASSVSNDFAIQIELDGASRNATITLIGPSDRWFGVGFGAQNMADQPYSIIVDGTGDVTERKLANHMPGSELVTTVDVISNTVGPKPQSSPKKMNLEGLVLNSNVDAEQWSDCRSMCDKDIRCKSWLYTPKKFTTPYNLQVVGTCTTFADNGEAHSEGWIEGMLCDTKSNQSAQNIRTVVLRRSLIGKTSEYFTFDPASSGIPIIEAVGTTSTFQYHGKSRGGMFVMLIEVAAPVCVCQGNSQGGSINGIPWANNCEDYPATTIMRDHNPSCSIETYEGGMLCCHHGIYLLDKNQSVPPDTFKFRMRFRFWYEDPETVLTTNVSISKRVWGDDLPYQNAFFMFRETEIAHGEYDVPKCEVGTKPEHCVHEIVGNFQVKDTMHECKGRSDVWCSPISIANMTYPQSEYVALVHISPHCHGPACISMKMIDRDRNNITICETSPVYGTTDNAMNESGYASGIPPCIWGTPEEGLPSPPILRLDSNITVIKRVNSTNGHRGVMGHWQMRGIWARGHGYYDDEVEEYY